MTFEPLSDAQLAALRASSPFTHGARAPFKPERAPMSLAKLFAEMDRAAASEEDTRSTPPDALCVTLREVATAYAAPCSFKAGDLVTPRQHYGTRGAGEPHIVLEVIKRPEPDFHTASKPGETHSCAYGGRRDVRVACETRGDITPFWMESWILEPYRGPDAGRTDA